VGSSVDSSIALDTSVTSSFPREGHSAVRSARPVPLPSPDPSSRVPDSAGGTSLPVPSGLGLRFCVCDMVTVPRSVRVLAADRSCSVSLVAAGLFRDAMDRHSPLPPTLVRPRDRVVTRPGSPCACVGDRPRSRRNLRAHRQPQPLYQPRPTIWGRLTGTVRAKRGSALPVGRRWAGL
jgi:hypothetical protein